MSVLTLKVCLNDHHYHVLNEYFSTQVHRTSIGHKMAQDMLVWNVFSGRKKISNKKQQRGVAISMVFGVFGPG